MRIPGTTQALFIEDGHDIVEWMAAQEWCDGKIGMWGPSALGMAQYRTGQINVPGTFFITNLSHATWALGEISFAQEKRQI